MWQVDINPAAKSSQTREGVYLGLALMVKRISFPFPFFLPPPFEGVVVPSPAEDDPSAGGVDPPDPQTGCEGCLPSPVTRMSISCRLLGFSKSARRSAVEDALAAGSEGNAASETGLEALGAVLPAADDEEEA